MKREKKKSYLLIHSPLKKTIKENIVNTANPEEKIFWTSEHGSLVLL